MNRSASYTRRDFLTAVAAAAGTTIVLPTVVPSSVFGADAPSNRIVMGAIGVGSQGTGDMQGFLSKPEVQMVAVCDVDKTHCDRARKIVDERYGNGDCKSYPDFRE
ncbi:MAG TPA: twin-arginine translocation signal domain-containing protein, partial [Sedimentisphaerales bacterium]|nr:twin-arginine translocation signal domain-containing protein [Sedimentisphaerales bacterium]